VVVGESEMKDEDLYFSPLVARGWGQVPASSCSKFLIPIRALGGGIRM